MFERTRTTVSNVKLSALEIYNDSLTDLLDPNATVEIREVNHNVHVQGKCIFFMTMKYQNKMPLITPAIVVMKKYN